MDPRQGGRRSRCLLSTTISPGSQTKMAAASPSHCELTHKVEGESAMALATSTYTIAHASLVQQANNLSAINGNVVVAGGNVTIHNHYYANPQQAISIVEVLRLVPNLRKIHLDVLSKATPGTAVWILQTEYFLLWLDPNGDLKVLWGTGIRRCLRTVLKRALCSNSSL